MTVGFKTVYNGRSTEIDDLLLKREFFSDGGLWTWGYNGAGNLGDGSTIGRSSPGTTAGGGINWKQTSANRGDNTGYVASAGIKSDGTLWTWGINQSYGQLGDGTTTTRSSPGTTAGGGTNWKQVSMGRFGGAAIKTDGTLWTWGRGDYGALGDGTAFTSRSSPGTTAGGGGNWIQVSYGFCMGAAVKSDGTLWTWGYNGGAIVSTGNNFDSYGGALGAGSFDATSGRSSPGTTSGGGTNWKQVSVTNTRFNTDSNAVGAVKTDGTLWVWGNNEAGNLGDASSTRRSSPVTTAGGGTNWKYVAMGLQASAAIKTDGTLWTWGQGTLGLLGSGATTNRTSPGTVSGGGTAWKQVSVGVEAMGAIKTDGTLWTWGRNINGSLGDGTTTNRSSPGTTAGGGTIWKEVSCGYRFAIAATDLTI